MPSNARRRDALMLYFVYALLIVAVCGAAFGLAAASHHPPLVGRMPGVWRCDVMYQADTGRCRLVMYVIP